MRALGLRLQIVLAIVGLMALAFLPLFFAVASLLRVTLYSVRVDDARSLGRAVAAHVAETDVEDPAALRHVLESHVGAGGVDAACVFDAAGGRVACAGDAREVTALQAPARPYGESDRSVRGARGEALDVTLPRGTGVVLVRMRTDAAADRAAPVVRLVAVYMLVFGIALSFLVYVALTRLIVRPVESLARATDRVASGARKLDVPKTGARELVELGASVETMAAALIADEESLRGKVDELTRAGERLTQAQAQLVKSERMASVGRLAAGVAHEIGNPITAIMGMQDLILSGDVSADEQRDFTERMHRETERIHHVLRDLLDFARPEAHLGPASDAAPPRADVREAVGDVTGLLRPQKQFREVEVETDVPEGLAARMAHGRLVQVLLNLALNACDAMTAARTEGARLRIHARREGERVHLVVEDTGPGVDRGVVARLFEPFVTTKEVGQGTGLGLAVCRGLVEDAGGSIDLDVETTQGARFVIDLPRAV